MSVVANMTTYEESDWDYNTTYTYYLAGHNYTWLWDATTQTWGIVTTQIESAHIPVTVRRVPVSAAQTVDTRIDPRFSTYVLKDFKFRDDKYRGGLFAGYNADGSKVARTYLKFTGIAAPPVAGQKLWPVGGLYLYLTRTAQANQPASVRARFVADDTWTPTTLVWSNAPSPKTSGEEAQSLSWTANTPGRWVNFNILPDLEETLDGTLSLALSAPNESNNNTAATFPLIATPGWAYFARAGYLQDGLTDLSAYLLYAQGGYGTGISSVNVATGTLHSNSSLSGSVSLTSPAPAGGLTVSLSSSAAYVTVPTSVTIPEGQVGASFTVT